MNPGQPMGRGETTDEFAARKGKNWAYYGGLPGDPGWVSDAARLYGDMMGVDPEALDDLAADHGWEHHDRGYDEKIKDLARRWKEIHETGGQ